MNNLIVTNIDKIISLYPDYKYSFYTLNRCKNLNSIKRIDEIRAFELVFKDFVPKFNELIIKTSENGKPYCENLNFKFNYSHSNNYFVLATSTEDIGVDIQRISNKTLKVSRMFLNEDEIKLIKDESYYTLFWTLKEALIKKLDLTLSNLLDIKIKKVSSKENYFRSVLIYKGEKFVLQSEIFKDYFISYTGKKRLNLAISD